MDCLQRHNRHRRRPGFTLIEVLVVVGIILILIGLVFFGMKHIRGQVGGNATKVNLQRLKGMMAELETTGKLSGRQPAAMWSNGVWYSSPNPINIWQNAQPDLTPLVNGRPIDTASDVGDVSMDQWDASKPSDSVTKRSRFQSNAVCNTQIAMRLLLQSPINRRAIEAFGQEGLLKNPEQGKSSPSHPIVKTGGGPNLFLLDPATGAANADPMMPPSPPNTAITPPVPLDSFGNPIILVPSAGLNVAIPWDGADPYKQGQIVSNSSKLYRAIKFANAGAQTTDKSIWEELPAGYNPIIQSPDKRPFFASAGPDGDFRTPDDNVYSFE